MLPSPALNHFSGCSLNSDDLSDLWGFIISDIPSGGVFWVRTKVQDREVNVADITSFLQHPDLRNIDILNFLDMGGKVSDRSIRIQVDDRAGATTQVRSPDSNWNLAISTKLGRFFLQHQPSPRKVRFLKQLKRRGFVSSIIGLALAFLMRYAATQQTLVDQIITIITSISWVYLVVSYYEWSKTPTVAGARIMLKPPAQSLIQRRSWEIMALVIAFLSLLFTIAQVIMAAV